MTSLLEPSTGSNDRIDYERQHAKLNPQELLAIGMAALVLRVVVFGAASVQSGLTLTQYAHLFDGESYIISAEAMLGDLSRFDAYQGRVFPGVPAMIALLNLVGIPMPVAALGLNWIAAAVAAALAPVLLRDVRVGWAMVMLIPHYLMNSTMTMTEAPLLALSIGGLILALRRQVLLGGVLLGIAGLVRPMACFAVLGYLTLAMNRKHWRHAIVVAAASGLVVLAGFIAMRQWRGDALAGVKFYVQSDLTYAGELLTWPFKSLIMTPIQYDVPIGRVIMLWTHIIVALAACVLLIGRLRNRTERDWRDVMGVPWLISNTAFALSVGHIWGFHCAHRFTIPAMPMMFFALRSALPRRWYMWALLAAGSAVFSVLAIVHDVKDG